MKPRYVLAITFASLTLVLFQNCSGPVSKGFNSVIPTTWNASGNGGGYDGKLFVETDILGACSGKSVEVKSAILKTSSGYYQTVRDCENLIPEKLDDSKLDFQQHSPEVLISGDKALFSESHLGGFGAASLQDRVFCRGSKIQADYNLKSVVDVYFHKKDEELLPHSSAKVGVYKSNSLFEFYDFPEKELTKHDPKIDEKDLHKVYAFNYNTPDDPNGDAGYRVTFFSDDGNWINEAFFLHQPGKEAQRELNVVKTRCYNY